jgi:flagellar motor switch protein FliN/FliY
MLEGLRALFTLGTRLLFREILELKVDSIVKLNRSAGENVELLMDGVPVGGGEIVVIEDLMGLRVTDLLLPKQARREK